MRVEHETETGTLQWLIEVRASNHSGMCFGESLD